MKVRSIALVLSILACLSALTLAQETGLPGQPMYAHPVPNVRAELATAATPLVTWNGSFVANSHTFRFNMVGTAPSTGVSTTIKTFIIPVKLTFSATSGSVTFNPFTRLSNGQIAVNNVLASPLFHSGIDFIEGGVNLGNTQYIDAFQRGNFWSKVSKAPGYHVLLGAPTVLPTLSLTVPKASGQLGTAFGIRVGLADINWLDPHLQNYMSSHSEIVPNSLPIFMIFDTYLFDAHITKCCIGGYHTSFGSLSTPQAYAEFSYLNKSGAFGEDVSALSHEVGEWVDDPLVVNLTGNPTPCGALEVGDPEETEPNSGNFPYTFNGFTYHLQDLVWLPYFGAPRSTSANGALTFHQNPFNLTVCSNGS